MMQPRAMNYFSPAAIPWISDPFDCNRCPRYQRYRQRGSTLLEGLLAVVIFSVGLLAILSLLTASIAQTSNVQFRSEASLLASDLISQMWTGDRSFSGIYSRFGSTTTEDYRRWLSQVMQRLPGISATANQPSVTIDSNRNVTVILYWRAPTDNESHQLKFQARITD